MTRAETTGAKVLDYKGPAPPVAAAVAATGSAWSPLRHRLFFWMWLATTVSYVGAEALSTGRQWLMRLLTADPAMVARTVSAATLPLALLAIIAGVLADVLDRRRLLIVTQIWMCVASVLLGVMYYLHWITPGVLLAMTFLFGIGWALSGPAFQAIIPELVPPGEMALAIGLNSVALNVARAVGPVLGMGIMALGRKYEAFGPGADFIIGGLAYIGVAWALYLWQRPPQVSKTRREQLWEGVRTGVRYTVHSPALRAILVRVLVFIFCASALWGLIVPLGKDQLHQREMGIGILAMFAGVGAIVGVFLMPWLQRELEVDGMVNLSTAVFGLCMLGVGMSRYYWLDCALLFFLGVSWVIVPTNFNIATQKSCPMWVKGRAIAMYWTVLWGSMSIGMSFWGLVARWTTIPGAFFIAGVGLMAGLLLVKKYPLTLAAGTDFRPAGKSGSWPQAAADLAEDGGPVMVTVEYQIDPARTAEFSQVMHELRLQRLRDGAYHWGLFGQARGAEGDGGRWVEQFIVRSWVDYLRTHERMTRSDAALEERALSFHRGDAPPAVKHWVHAPDPRRERGSTRGSTWASRVDFGEFSVFSAESLKGLKERFAAERELFLRRCGGREAGNGRQRGMGA